MSQVQTGSQDCGKRLSAAEICLSIKLEWRSFQPEISHKSLCKLEKSATEKVLLKRFVAGAALPRNYAGVGLNSRSSSRLDAHVSMPGAVCRSLRHLQLASTAPSEELFVFIGLWLIYAASSRSMFCQFWIFANHVT